jgi:hypothetical protein
MRVRLAIEESSVYLKATFAKPRISIFYAGFLSIPVFTLPKRFTNAGKGSRLKADSNDPDHSYSPKSVSKIAVKVIDPLNHFGDELMKFPFREVKTVRHNIKDNKFSKSKYGIDERSQDSLGSSMRLANVRRACRFRSLKEYDRLI